MTTPVVSAPDVSSQVIWADKITAGQSGVVSAGVVRAVETLSVQCVRPTNGTTPTSLSIDIEPVSGGGYTANHAAFYIGQDVALATPAASLAADVYTATSTGVVGTASVPVFRTNNSLPINYSAPWIGSFTGTGAPLVVACVGITPSASVRYWLVGSATNVLATATAVPSALSIQANVSFTITAATGAIYNYEVLLA
jgi:hypothetical protein